MAKKFIIEGAEFKMGNPDFHYELASNEKNVIGGGWWELDREKKELLLYGQSTDFGSVTKEQIIAVRDAVRFMSFKGYSVFYSDELKLEYVSEKTLLFVI